MTANNIEAKPASSTEAEPVSSKEAKPVSSTEKDAVVAKPRVAFRPQDRALHDSNVTLEEYMYYATKTRAEEDSNALDAPKTTLMDVLFPSRGKASLVHGTSDYIADSDGPVGDLIEINLNKAENRAAVSETEWTNASRALRSASTAAAFYLITCDIIGSFGIGFGIATMGWARAVILFTLFGACAGFSGYLLWKVFMNVDSHEFAARNYGDLGFRIWGPWFRHVVNILQTIQLILVVGVIVIANGQSISQVSKFRLCYVVCCLIWTLAGFVLGQIRTLNRFGFLANWGIVMTLLIMFISMGVIANSPPNYVAAQVGSAGAELGGAMVAQNPDGSWPPIITHGSAPPSANGFIGGILGLMQGVYAYAGAQLFVEFMAELQRPRDFLKAMWAAQFFIYACYMTYGLFIYHFQGQYANQVAYQGISPYGWQTACNIIAVFSALIAMTLYANIGIKGKYLWAVIVPFYWSLAFLLAASIPNFFGLTGVTAAICLVQATYTFPAFMGLGLFVQKGAMLGEPEFDPVTGNIHRRDSGFRRLVRGYFGKYWLLNIILTIFTLGSLAVSGLGAYFAISSLIETFKMPQTTAFTCKSPLGP